MVSARVLFHGTHGLCVNSGTRLRDQERAPIAADLKRSVTEKAKVDELTFALSADVAESHRQVTIHPDDWHYLGCQVVPGGDVFVNTVGTFGIASASCYWSRVAGAIGRLLQYLSGHGHVMARLSQMTICWNAAGLGIGQDSYSSSCCVLWLAFRYPGTKLAGERRLSG